MIRTRLSPDDVIAGSGRYTISMTYEEAQVIGAFLYLVNMGPGVFQTSAMKLLETLEEVTSDSDFGGTSLRDVGPCFNVHDEETYNVISMVDGAYISVAV